MAFQNHEGQVRSFQVPWPISGTDRAERSREEGQPVRALSAASPCGAGGAG